MSARGFGLALLLALSVLAVPGFIERADAGTRNYTLFGDLSGWGFTAATTNNPGPTLFADQGDTVNMNLQANDGFTHFWFLDYNNDGNDDAAEPKSQNIPDSFSFAADTAGSFTYRCGIHTSSMTGTFQINATDQPPAVVISQPNGNQRWTGGSAHDVVWTMTDPDTPVTDLVAWVNYSIAAGTITGTIAGPVNGTTNPHTVSWTVPVVNATDATVVITAVDSTGLSNADTALVPDIDSQRPTVMAVSPMNTATGISTARDVVLTFSEGMSTAATAGAVTLESAAGPAAFGTSWTAGNTVLTLNPTADLSPSSTYWVNASTAAKDSSDPGNALAAAFSASFTTGAAPPVISVSNVTAAPDPVELADTVTVGAELSGSVTQVWFDIADIGNGTGSLNATSGRYERTVQALPWPGTFAVTVAATDGTMWAVAVGSFDVVDTTAPGITHTPPGATAVFTAISLTFRITDLHNLVEVNVTYTDTRGDTAMIDVTIGASADFAAELPPQLVAGTVTYAIAAADPSGNEGLVDGSVTITAAGTVALYGTTTGGWGLSPANITAAGPTLTAEAGTSVTWVVVGWDAVPHYLYVDLDGDGQPDAAEPRSAEVTGNFTTFTLTAPGPGTYDVYCGYHPNMRGKLVVPGGDGGAPGGGIDPLVLVLVAVVLLATVGAAVALRRSRDRKGPGEDGGGP